MSVVATMGILLLTSSGDESADFGCAADPMALQGIYPEFIGWTENIHTIKINELTSAWFSKYLRETCS